MQQGAAPLQQFHDGSVSLPYALAVVLWQTVAQDAFFVHITGRIQTVLDAGGEVLRAMRRRGVNNSRPRIHSDVVGQHPENLAVEKRMLKLQPLHLPAGELRQFTCAYKA